MADLVPKYMSSNIDHCVCVCGAMVTLMDAYFLRALVRGFCFFLRNLKPCKYRFSEASNCGSTGRFLEFKSICKQKQ
jgi:hypothetical protein